MDIILEKSEPWLTKTTFGKKELLFEFNEIRKIEQSKFGGNNYIISVCGRNQDMIGDFLMSVRNSNLNNVIDIYSSRTSEWKGKLFNISVAENKLGKVWVIIPYISYNIEDVK